MAGPTEGVRRSRWPRGSAWWNGCRSARDGCRCRRGTRASRRRRTGSARPPRAPASWRVTGRPSRTSDTAAERPARPAPTMCTRATSAGWSEDPVLQAEPRLSRARKPNRSADPGPAPPLQTVERLAVHRHHEDRGPHLPPPEVLQQPVGFGVVAPGKTAELGADAGEAGLREQRARAIAPSRRADRAGPGEHRGAATPHPPRGRAGYWSTGARCRAARRCGARGAWERRRCGPTARPPSRPPCGNSRAGRRVPRMRTTGAASISMPSMMARNSSRGRS